MGISYRPLYRSDDEFEKGRAQREADQEFLRRIEAEMMKALPDSNRVAGVTSVPGLESISQPNTSMMVPVPEDTFWQKLARGIAESNPLAPIKLPDHETKFTRTHTQDRNRQLGSAAYYGIREALSLSPEDLEAQIQARRATAQHSIRSERHPLASLGEAILPSLAEGFANGNRLALGAISRLGVGGEVIADILDKAVKSNELQQWAAELQEAARSRTPTTHEGLHHAGSLFGSFVGHVPMGLAAYRLAGAITPRAAAGTAIGRLMEGSALARGAIQGAVADNMLMAGDDMPWVPSQADFATFNDGTIAGFQKVVLGNRLGNTLFGAAAGLAFDAIADKLASSPATAAPRQQPLNGPIAWLPGEGSQSTALVARDVPAAGRPFLDPIFTDPNLSRPAGGRARYNGPRAEANIPATYAEPHVPRPADAALINEYGPVVEQQTAVRIAGLLYAPRVDLDTEAVLVAARQNAAIEHGMDANGLASDVLDSDMQQLSSLGASAPASTPAMNAVQQMPQASPVRMSTDVEVPDWAPPQARQTLNHATIAARIIELQDRMQSMSGMVELGRFQQVQSLWRDLNEEVGRGVESATPARESFLSAHPWLRETAAIETEMAQLM
jgi:hypothetical protein